MTRRTAALLFTAATALAALSCGNDDAPGTHYPRHLSTWGFFSGELRTLTPVAGVVPYEVIAVLWADHAEKERFIRLPAASTIHYDASEKWVFPTGTIIIKNFGFPDHVVETRLLVLEDDGWHPVTYRWSEDQSDALYEDTGPAFPVAWTDTAGASHMQTYKMPNLNQCRTCHGETTFGTIGLRTRQVDRTHDYGSGPENQIDHMAALGMFDATPNAPATRDHLSDPFGTDAIERRAHSYLDANCAHCHSEPGHAGRSGFWIDWNDYRPGHDGVCKVPESCGSNCGGFQFDIVPGNAADSIITYRMGSVEAGARMPEIGTLVVDDQGVALIHDWVQSLPADDCTGSAPDAGMVDAGSVDAATD